MAISRDVQPSYTHIAKFVRELSDDITLLFGQVLQTQDLDAKHQTQVDRIRSGAKATREFVANNKPRLNAKGQELKSNVTDNESAKIGSPKGAIQGFAAQAAVDDKRPSDVQQANRHRRACLCKHQAQKRDEPVHP
jgi:hypothetical protein